jgi:hypothetical protein
MRSLLFWLTILGPRERVAFLAILLVFLFAASR